ncbi:MAG: molecular chaperone DnaJ [Deltaproteobacteria bacterium]|nr:molecular chaperone DnaJ [Deltaproteobacteria bacterium]
MNNRDYYEILDIPRDAGEEEIKKAYRKLAMKYHPDKNPGNKDAEEQFKEASEAYEVLRDREKRQIYDQYGHEGLKGMGFNGFNGFNDIFSSFGDIFEDFFSFGGGRSGGTRARKGKDLRYDMELTLEEAFSGKEGNISFKKWVRCEACEGSGITPGSEVKICSTCQGTGSIITSQGFFRIKTTCPKCNGRGKIITNPCRECNGEGKVQRKKDINFKIPPGVDNGSQLRLRGEGEAGEHGGPPGDLFIVLHIKEHELFSREGDDLFAEIPISFVQAALGDNISIPILGQEELKEVKIPQGSQPGDVITLSGLGMPGLNRRQRGDLHLRLNVRIPKKLSGRQKEILEEFARSEETKTPNIIGKIFGAG